MSAPQSDGRTNADIASGQRRIRHDARDGISVAALSLCASVGVTLAIWALLRWLG